MTDPNGLLASGYADSGFDAFVARDLLADEIHQLAETGYRVDDAAAAVNAIDPDDEEAQLRLLDELREDDLERGPWPYEEPTALEEIADTWRDLPSTPVSADSAADAIHAGWLGRIAGCNLGKPVEQAAHWTVEKIRDYLVLADAYPLDDYFPVISPMPDGYRLLDNWRETGRGLIDGSARDDDIDYTILGLHMLEQDGHRLSPGRVGEYWTQFLPIEKTYTAERAAYRNVVRGLRPPDTARFRNPYREWIGALIRGDVFGYAFPGEPQRAARLAYQDAALSHVRNGVYGEMWVAALIAAAFTTTDAAEALETAFAFLPPGSRFAQSQRRVLEARRRGIGWDQAVAEIRADHAGYPWVHAVNNAAVVTAALLWADSDWASAAGKAVMSGWDTDSNGATVGSVAGVLWGTGAVPERFVAPLRDRTRSALFGFDNSVISSLAERTVRLIDALR